MNLNKIPVEIVADSPDFIPQYKTYGSAAADLVANIPNGEISLLPGCSTIVDVGFSMALPVGWEAQVRPRSGLAAEFQLQVTNSPGTIDSDYRGRVKVILNNAGQRSIIIKHGERFAQICIKPVFIFDWRQTESLQVTERGKDGFGSTGK